MLVRQVKELIAEETSNCIYKDQYQNDAFQSADNLNFENFSLGPTMVAPIVNSGYERKSSAFSVTSA